MNINIKNCDVNIIGTETLEIKGQEMTETEKEQRRYALAISGGVCEVCGRPY